jgi:hypothetical protein
VEKYKERTQMGKRFKDFPLVGLDPSLTSDEQAREWVCWALGILLPTFSALFF